MVDGEEVSPLDSKSLYWMEIRIMDSGGRSTKALSLKDGYFEMQLPQAILRGQSKVIYVELD